MNAIAAIARNILQSRCRELRYEHSIVNGLIEDMAKLKLRQLLVATGTAMLTVGWSQISWASSQPLPTSSPDFPITQLRWWNFNSSAEQPWQPITLTVPDQDTTRSAYGGILRRYDVHIAKMVEVSHHYCQQDDTLEGFRWDYEAANGNVYMGRFDISCKLAQTIVAAYGPTRTERTEVSFGNIQPDEVRENPYARDYEILVLNIDTNAKLQRWRQYVQTVRPVFSHPTVMNATAPFSAGEVLSQLGNKVNVPVLIPNKIPNIPWLVDWMQEYGTCASTVPDGYGYQFALGPCVPGPSRRGFDSFSATAIDHLPQFALDDSNRHIGPKDTWREVELARGVKGTFHISCGPYCTSSLTWEYQRTRYSIFARFGSQPFMIKLANSALEAGDRRLGAY